MPKNNKTEDYIKKYNLNYVADNDTNYYLVEKTGCEKAIICTMKIIATPIAVTLDTAGVCLIVVGSIAAGASQSANPSGNYSVSQPSHNGQSITYNTIGNMTYGSDGTTYRTINNMTYGSDGTTYRTINNMTYGSDGTMYRTINNMTYGSDGTTYNTIGNMTYGSDGSMTRRIGNMYYYNK